MPLTQDRHRSQPRPPLKRHTRLLLEAGVQPSDAVMLDDVTEEALVRFLGYITEMEIASLRERQFVTHDLLLG
jgi:hypothetical protein